MKLVKCCDASGDASRKKLVLYMVFVYGRNELLLDSLKNDGWEQ